MSTYRSGHFDQFLTKYSLVKWHTYVKPHILRFFKDHFPLLTIEIVSYMCLTISYRFEHLRKSLEYNCKSFTAIRNHFNMILKSLNMAFIFLHTYFKDILTRWVFSPVDWVICVVALPTRARALGPTEVGKAAADAAAPPRGAVGEDRGKIENRKSHRVMLSSVSRVLRVEQDTRQPSRRVRRRRTGIGKQRLGWQRYLHNWSMTCCNFYFAARITNIRATKRCQHLPLAVWICTCTRKHHQRWGRCDAMQGQNSVPITTWTCTVTFEWRSVHIRTYCTSLSHASKDVWNATDVNLCEVPSWHLTHEHSVEVWGEDSRWTQKG